MRGRITLCGQICQAWKVVPQKFHVKSSVNARLIAAISLIKDAMNSLLQPHRHGPSAIHFARLVAAGAITLLSVSCSNYYRTQAAYNMLGRTELLTGKEHTFLVGIEKRPKKDIGWAKEALDQRLHDVKAADRPGISENEVQTQNQKKKGFFNDGRELFVSHVVETREGQITKFVYNDYKRMPQPKHCNGLDEGLKALQKLEDEVRLAFQRERYSHVLVLAMGWANDQEESVTRFRMIAKHLRTAAGSNSKYKPLVIGITWPSQWWGLSDWWLARKAGHLLSVFNKANDADAVGMFTLNLLVNHHLASAVPSNVPLVLMGHSYGARAISRAAYSRDMLAHAGPHHVDLIISMQPAYSVNRFIPRQNGKGGVEGAPYVVPDTIPHFITSSVNDAANPVARWSRFGGGKLGLNTAKKSDLLFVCKWDENQRKLQPPPPDLNKPVVIDASSIVKEHEPVTEDEDVQTRSGHNDVLDKEMGQLNYHLLQFIKRR
jgi:hypothetical protein